MPVPAIPPAWSPQDSLQRVGDAAAGRGSRVRHLTDGSLLMTCVNPAHEDRNPSLHASWVATEHGGRTLLHCPACGHGVDQQEWADLLGLEFDDLFDDRRWSLHNRATVKNQARSATRGLAKRGPGKPPGPLPKPIAGQLDVLLEREPAPVTAEDRCEHEFVPTVVYPYRDPVSNRVVQQVIRQVCVTCGDKTFRQSYLSGRRWVNREPAGFAPVLYRQREVLQAAAAGGEVWLVEGEKDADSAARLGLVSTTNARGGAHFPPELAAVLTGAHVSVVLDRDSTGWQRGVVLHKVLTEAGAATVRLLLPAVDELKADLTDHLEAGHGVADLLETPVQAVAAWAGMAEVQRCIARLDAADAEARAQLEVAEHDRKQGRRKKAQDRVKYATRWGRESVRLFAMVRAAAVKVAEQAGLVPGDRWGEQAAELAGSQVQAAATLARATHELVGLPIPDELHAQTVHASAVAVMGGESSSAATVPGASPTEFVTGEDGRPDLQVVSGGGGGGGGSSRFVPGIEIVHDKYEAINGEVVQVKRVQVGRGETAEWRTVYHRVINKVIRVARKEQAESDEDLEREVLDLESLGDRDERDRDQVQALRKITHVVFTYDGADGTEMSVRVAHDDADSGAWLSHLAEPGLDYVRTRPGREKTMTAINAISTDFEVSTAYRATGWRRRPDGTWMYITADGAIDAEGYQPELTNLTGPLSRFSWPNPTTEPARLRQAFLRDSAGMMDRFPDRVAAVLCGHAYRTVLAPNEWVTVLSASPGIGKTGLASLTMHHFGELWDRHRPMSSMSGNGATMNAIRLLANQAKDATMFLDDVAPTAGLDQAWKRLEETTRLISNQESRPRAERDGQGVLPGTRPRTSALITTELPPRAGTSGERRALIVPLNRVDVSIEDVKAMDAMESRHGRALLVASYLQWLATDVRGFMLRAVQLREEFTAQMAAVPRHPRAWDRHGAKVAELWAGWSLMLEFLTERGALSQGEAQQWRERVTDALYVAAESCEDPDLVSCTGERVAELLRFALSNGLAYGADIRTGQAPTGLEGRLGWQPQPVRGGQHDVMGLGSQVEWRHDPRAVRLGFVNADPVNGDEPGRELVCERTALEATLKAAAQAMADTSGVDLGTVLRALEDEGILKVAFEKRRGGVVPRRTLVRTVWALHDSRDPAKPLRAQRVVLRLDELLESGPGDDDQQPLGDADGPRGRGPVDGDASPTTPAGPARGTSGESTVMGEAADAPSGGPAQMEEATVAEHENAGGLRSAAVQLDETRPCTLCEKPSAFAFEGIVLHLPCFWSTTATSPIALHREMDALTSPGQDDVVPEPAAAAAPPAAASGPAQSTVSPAPERDQRRSVPGSTAQPTRRTRTGFRASVAVVDVDAAWLPDGTRVELDEPITHLGHLEQIGRGLNLGHPPMAWRKIPEAGLVVPTEAVWEQLGVRAGEAPSLLRRRQEWFEQISQDLPALTQAVEQGWVFGRGDRDPVLRGLTRLRRADAERGSVAVLFTAGMHTDYGLTGEPAEVARRLQLFADAVGLPFRGSPVSTGLDLMSIVLPKATRDALAPENSFDYDQVGPAAAADLEPQFDWTRPLLPSETNRSWLALYDRGGSYLAGWSSLRLGVGAPELLEGEAAVFDPKRAGWWLVQLPDRSEERDPFPNVLDPEGNRAGQQVWVTTPALEYATAPEPNGMGWEVPVIKAWAWPADRSKPVLAPLYKVLREALNQLRELGPDDEDAKAAATLVKQIYKQLSGHFVGTSSDLSNRDRSTLASNALNVHQPYWTHAMMATARRAILHQIMIVGRATGTWPVVASNNDLIGYVVDEPDLRAAWPGRPEKYGYGLGQYKAARWAPLQDHLQYLTGGGWSGREATTTIDEGLPAEMSDR